LKAVEKWGTVKDKEVKESNGKGLNGLKESILTVGIH
jgi:hypothetical protein